MSDTSALASAIGYQFSNPSLLRRALTHRSASRAHNERMEFLGDAILGYLIADALYQEFPDAREGDLTRARASLVRRETLAAVAREIELGSHLHVGGGELKSGGRDRDSILADALEALLGAIYLDGGMEACHRTVLGAFGSRLREVSVIDPAKDPKTRLQELVQSRQLDLPQYVVREVEGEDHAQSFTVECLVGGLDASAVGVGGNRRQAEQAAARKLLESIRDG